MVTISIRIGNAIDTAQKVHFHQLSKRQTNLLSDTRNEIKGISIKCLFPRLRCQSRTQILMYAISIPHGLSRMLNLTTNNSTSIIDFKRGTRFVDGSDDTNAYSAYDTRMKKYRHMNFFEHECHLYVRTPRIKRDDGKVRLILPPWAGPLNGFSTLFEVLIIKFCKHMPVHNGCQLMNIST